MVMKERGISRLVGGSFNKQGNFQMRLVLDKMRTFPHLPCRILKVYPEAVNRVQACMPSTWSLPHITLSRMHPENDPRVGTDCCQDRGGVKSLRLPGSSSRVKQQSHPLMTPSNRLQPGFVFFRVHVLKNAYTAQISGTSLWPDTRDCLESRLVKELLL